MKRIATMAAVMGMFLLMSFGSAMAFWPYIESNGLYRGARQGVFNYAQVAVFPGNSGVELESISGFNSLTLEWSDRLGNYDWFWREDPAWSWRPINETYSVMEKSGDILNWDVFFDMKFTDIPSDAMFSMDIIYSRLDAKGAVQYWVGDRTDYYAGMFHEGVYVPREFDTTPAVPEPSTIALVGMGIVLFSAAKKRRG